MKRWRPTFPQRCQAFISITKIQTLVTFSQVKTVFKAIKVATLEIHALNLQNKRPAHKMRCVDKLEVFITPLKYLTREYYWQIRNMLERPDPSVAYRLTWKRSKSTEVSSAIMGGYKSAERCINARILVAVKLLKTDLIWKFTLESIQEKSLLNAPMDVERDSTTTQTA